MKTFLYVDGFNLYYSARKGTPLRWLNPLQLAARVKPGVHGPAAACADARSHPAALSSAKENPAVLMIDQSHPAALKAARLYPAFLRDGGPYPAACADAKSQPADLASAAENPTVLMVDQSHPAALQIAASRPASLKDNAFSSLTERLSRAARTAFTARTLRIVNKPGVRAAEDAMSGREEEAPPALAASMMRTQRWRVASSAAARHTSL
jgi:hypothetical protein